MKNFLDSLGRSWCVGLDAFILGDVRDECKLDLADAAGWQAIESDEVQLVRALVVICRDEIAAKKMTPREFGKSLVGQAIDAARQAALEAAADFFPPRRWSEIQSRWRKAREAAENWAEVRPILQLLADPAMPETLRDGIMLAIREKIGGESESTDLPTSAGDHSASGPATSPLSLVSGSLDSSVSTPKG